MLTPLSNLNLAPVSLVKATPIIDNKLFDTTTVGLPEFSIIPDTICKSPWPVRCKAVANGLPQRMKLNISTKPLKSPLDSI